MERRVFMTRLRVTGGEPEPRTLNSSSRNRIRTVQRTICDKKRLYSFLWRGAAGLGNG